MIPEGQVLRVILANAATGGAIYPTEDRPVVLVHESGVPYLVIKLTETWFGRHGHFSRRLPPTREIARAFHWLQIREDQTFRWKETLVRFRAMQRMASAK
jgi:hypothetical protein